MAPKGGSRRDRRDIQIARHIPLDNQFGPTLQSRLEYLPNKMNEISADSVKEDAPSTAAALPATDQPTQPQRTAAKRLGKKRTSQDKISQLHIYKKKLKRKLDELEEGEVDDADAYVYMDKIRSKLLQIEKALFDADVYDDAQADPTAALYPAITIANSGFQPLNELLTEFVNDSSNKAHWDNLLGYRHVGPFDVNEMVQKLRNKGFGESIDQILGKKVDDTFLTETSERTNKWCKRSRLSATADNWIIQTEDWVKAEDMETLDAKLATEDLQAVSLDNPNGGPGPSTLLQAGKTIVEELTRLQNDGQLQDGVPEPAGAIDLDANGEEDERRGASEDEEEEDGTTSATSEEAPARVVTDGGDDPIDEEKGEATEDAAGDINLDEDIDLDSDEADEENGGEQDDNGGSPEATGGEGAPPPSTSAVANNGLPREAEVIQLSDSDDNGVEDNEDDDDIQFLG